MQSGQYTYNFFRPSVTVDCAVITSTTPQKILLIRRKNEPFCGTWALPGGFVDMDEDLRAAALRELDEETGIVVAAATQFRTYGKPGRDPRGRTISVVYIAVIEKPIVARAGDDAEKAEWFEVTNLPDLAFDHPEIIKDILDSLSNKYLDVNDPNL